MGRRMGMRIQAADGAGSRHKLRLPTKHAYPNIGLRARRAALQETQASVHDHQAVRVGYSGR